MNGIQSLKKRIHSLWKSGWKRTNSGSISTKKKNDIPANKAAITLNTRGLNNISIKRSFFIKIILRD